jgi:hypothetical protein
MNYKLYSYTPVEINTVYLSNKNVFVMKDDGEIHKANECALAYKERVINILERMTLRILFLSIEYIS